MCFNALDGLKWMESMGLEIKPGVGQGTGSLYQRTHYAVLPQGSGYIKAFVETLMTREERLRSEDLGNYFRVTADSRDLNYDRFVVEGHVETMADEAYTSDNTVRLDVEGVVRKLLTADYVKKALGQ